MTERMKELRAKKDKAQEDYRATCDAAYDKLMLARNEYWTAYYNGKRDDYKTNQV